MDVERVKGPSGQKGVDKKARHSTPDSEEFREMMKAQKVGEPEFEKPKKRKFGQEREEKGAQTGAPQAQPSSLPGPYERPSTARPPTEYYENAAPPPATDQNDDKQTKEKKRKEKQEEAAFLQKSLLEEKKALKEETKKVTKKTKTTTTVPAPKTPKKEELPVVEKTKEEEKKKQPEKEVKTGVSTVLQEFPPNIAAQTGSITSILTPYLHPDIVPLFEKMVGTIVQIKAQGVTQTEVMLNSPAFTSSLFFGSSIIVQKYSTAPDSFNIFLRGPAQAVNMFTENLSGLFDAFKKANINIGRLEAQHEKPLFKRKEKTGEKGDES
ncbi:MAG: hypothetical protein K940chlam1_00984 [Candidatus Anoxychlamydiales bacterium]|nr:hypothetical protein [Candidatus Anoxychlamydiales bacterium]NGX36324.1 hypothetical protein [Candidatus Anoxychlamydiales bacterium]